MLKIRQLQKQKQEQEAAAAAAASAGNGSSQGNNNTMPNVIDTETTLGSTTGQRQMADPARIRAQKDISELQLPKTIKLIFDNVDDLMNFKIVIQPNEGYYRNGKFSFTCEIPSSYPIQPPKLKCLQKIYHPNIDLEGNICLNILREDWSPVLTIHAVLAGLQLLFLEPNPNDPLNKEAANDLKKDKDNFKRNVFNSMRGGRVNYEVFDVVI